MSQPTGIDPQALARGIQGRRLALDLSQADLAIRAKVTAPYIWRLESGRAKRPSADHLERIASALGLTDWRQLMQPPSADANPPKATKRPSAIATSGPDESRMSDADLEKLRQIMREEIERSFAKRGMPPPTEDELP